MPTRIAIASLAFSFDCIPHYRHRARGPEDPYRATSNRAGLEWLLTPLMLFQNCHLFHHLNPTVPFFRYPSVRCAREDFHLAPNAIISRFRLRHGHH